MGRICGLAPEMSSLYIVNMSPDYIDLKNDSLRMQDAIDKCREMAQFDQAYEFGIQWAGDLDECAHCGERISPQIEFFADAETYQDDGVWGLLCPVCLTYGGNEMVWGKGQLYQFRSDSNVWLLVAGFPPASEERGDVE